jgi:hypothetical protein
MVVWNTKEGTLTSVNPRWWLRLRESTVAGRSAEEENGLLQH